MVRACKRLYTRRAIEVWFQHLEPGWEHYFASSLLETGRDWYRKSRVRSLEISIEDSIIHGEYEDAPFYAVIEWKEGKPCIRLSTKQKTLGYTLAIAGLYEIEELVSEEVLPLPEDRADKGLREVETVPLVVPVPQKSPQPSRNLKVLLRWTKEGLILEPIWQKDLKTPNASVEEKEITAEEREQLIRLMASARQAGFYCQSKSKLYYLNRPHAIGQFVRCDLPQWRKKFVVETQGPIAELAKVHEVALTIIAQTEGDGLGLKWEASIGESVLENELALTLLQRGKRPLFLPDQGMVALNTKQVEGLIDCRTWLDQQGAGALPRYLLYSLFWEGVPLRRSPDLQQWQASLAHLDEKKKLPLFLFPYQKKGVQWLHHLCKHGCHPLLADEMGLGKTLQTATLIANWPVGEKPHLIVCPSSVIPVWQNELEKFFPKLEVAILNKNDSFSSHKKSMVWLASYTQLRRHKAKLAALDFGYAILDEAQSIKNPDTKAAAACLAIKAKHRIALTGTPLENKALDLWTLFRFLMPGLLGSRIRFESRLRTDGAGFLNQLKQQIRPFVLRRTKEEAAKDLPEKSVMECICPLTEVQEKIYREISKEGIESFGGNWSEAMAEHRFSVLALLTRLRQVSCDPALLPNRNFDLGQSGKLNRLFELLERIFTSGNKVVIFSQFVRLLSRVEQGLAQLWPNIPRFTLKGNTPDRAKPVKDFQGSKGAAAMLVSLRAGGSGITLHSAEYVFVLDPWWNPAVEQQAIDRVHRVGQKRPVFVYRMIAQGTIEEAISRLQSKKQGLFDELIGSLSSINLANHYSSLEELVQLKQRS